ncbi:hypothetical protein [Bacillus xiapuensis]|uniref:Uncharacterized protein n=1 Tax=Bacillus xiapuensis TaxID=2014075 RepID=A0ABU6NAY8_9BACI|nr:hypothetical protein [Bacillus xiapuensis]
MEKLIFKNKQYIQFGEDRFLLELFSYECDNHLINEIDVVIWEVNDMKVYYVHSTSKNVCETDRYVKAIQEAVISFNNDKSIQSLLNWDGKINKQVSYKLIGQDSQGKGIYIVY